MINDKGIIIQNIYYMLTYAFQVLKQKNYEEIGTESFENIHNLFSAILSKGLAQQLKQGLYREYITEYNDLPTVRGKINLQATIKLKIQRKQLISCEFDELSVNNYFNQIIKSTVMFLIREKTVSNKYKKELKKEMFFFSEVDEIDITQIKWESLKFHKNNQSYKMLLNICYFIIKGLLYSDEKGKYKVASFLDEILMCKLYEKFILEYYRYHYKGILQANSTQVKWDVDDDVIEFLPIMKTDIMLKKDDRTLIIDAKYYGHMMQTSQYNHTTVHSGNLYQIFTYVKNYDTLGNGKVSGMLLYAKTEETIAPNKDYNMKGNKISVRTLDLNLMFDNIRLQLDDIVKKEFNI